MARPSAIAVAVLLALGCIAWPSTAQPQALQVQAARAGAREGDAPATLANQPSHQDPAPESQKPKENGKGQADGHAVRFVWKTGPSLRVGNDLRVDFRVKLQSDFRESDQDLERAGGTLEIPRRRVGIEGHVFRVVEYEVERDFAENGRWRDVYVNVRPFDPLQFQAGQFKVPFSLDHLTGATQLDFLYRSLAADLLAPKRDVGFMVHGHAWDHAVGYELGSFRGDGENAPEFEPPPLLDDEPWEVPSRRSVAGRVTVRPLAPLSAPKYFDSLELGVSAMRSELPEGPNHLPGQTLFGTRFFARGFYVNGARTRTGFDVSWSPGPASLRGEYIRVEDAREGVGVGNENGLDTDLPPLPASGWYVSGTWLVTGEKKESRVEPRRTFPLHGPGAIEVGARYEELRFGGGDTSEPPSLSPRAANAAGNAVGMVTLGVNWYLNRFIKVQLNGIRERLEDAAASPVPGREAIWTVACRLQLVL